MTRIFTEGMEMGDVLGFSSATGSASTSTTRSGAYSLVCSNGQYAYINTADNAEIYVRFGLVIGEPAYDNIDFFTWKNGATVLGALKRDTSTQFIEIYVGSTQVATGNVILPGNTWVLIEVHIIINDTTGIIECEMNGLPCASFSGDTKPASLSVMNQFYWGGYTSKYYDDIAINDTNGGADNSWCGDGHIIKLTPNANGDLSQLTGSDGNFTDNYLLVDEAVSDGDSTYVEGSTVNEKDLYNLSASGLGNVVINRVFAESRSKDTVTGGGLIALTVKTNSSEYDSSDVSLATSYTSVKGPEYLVNPQSSSAWSVSELDALQVGPKTRS